MSRLFLNTYAPLVASQHGREASENLGIPPFVDGSIRREPDLEHDFPSITCLCRGANFAPRLRVDDHVGYLTKKAKYGPQARHRRLTAILQVVRLFPSHSEAAVWYRSQGLGLPSNCMVVDNPPRPLGESHRRGPRGWDIGYQLRARRNGRFVVCRPLWRNLEWGAPIVQDADLRNVFGRVPGTRNPGVLPIEQLSHLVAHLKIRCESVTL